MGLCQPVSAAARHALIHEEKQMTGLTKREMVAVLRIKAEIVRAAGSYLREQGFTEILPVLLSPVTDPLHHDTFDGTVDYYGVPYQLTKSMILHKQLALRTVPKIFSFAPNVRMEPEDRASAGRYLAEFVQLDLEVRDASRDEILGVGEGVFLAAISGVLEHCREKLEVLGRDLRLPAAPFERITFADAAGAYGEPFDAALSADRTDPVWVIDFPRRVREFYDREDPERPEVLLDMDLMYPEGFGEALSGGEREHLHDRLVDRISRDNIPLSKYAPYLEEAKAGLPSSAGFGIGIERLTRYACGLESVAQARLFPKIPGDTTAL